MLKLKNGFCVLLTYCREGFIHITCWRSCMPQPGYLQPDKFHEMADLVLTKEPKVQSTAVRE